MKNVLYFFPDNIGQQTAGNKTRAIQLLKYFKERGCHVDFVSLKHERPEQGSEQDTIDFLKTNKLADRVHLLQRKPSKKNPLVYFLRYKIFDLFYYWFTYPLRSKIPTFLTVKLKNEFEAILKANTYDYVIISYVTCAGLVANRKLLGNAKTIVDTHDFITAQFKDKRRFNLGATFADEINRLNIFDEIWAISYEEQYVFSQFCSSDVRLVPLMIDVAETDGKPLAEKKYDLIYIASDNVHNLRAANWFFDNVYRLLPPGISICVIGLINKSISDRYNIERIMYAPDLDKYYNNAKIAICPMLSGTGVKVKVVEALAFGLPVVCNLRGLDGLPNKQLNGCLATNNPTEFAEHIVSLLSNEAAYLMQSLFAKELFSNAFGKSVIYNELDSAFK